MTIESATLYTKLMASNENHCVGCGDCVQPGQRRILANNNRLLIIWREVFREKLNELNLEINEDHVLGLSDDSGSKAFICRKCTRGFESYDSAKKKLLDNANDTLRYISTTSLVCCSRPSNLRQTTTSQGRRRPREDSEDGDMCPPPAKRTFRPTTIMSKSSPDVQVSDCSTFINIEDLYTVHQNRSK